MFPQARNFTFITPVVGAETRIFIFIKSVNCLLVNPFEPQVSDFANWLTGQKYILLSFSDIQHSLLTSKIHKENASGRIQRKWWLG